VSLLVHKPRRLEDQKSGLVDCKSGLRDPRSNYSLLGERFSKCGPRLRSLVHKLKRTLSGPDQPHAMMDPSGTQPALSDLKSPAFTQKQILLWHAYIFKVDLGMAAWGVVISKDIEHPLDLHSFRIHRHKDHR